MPTFGLAALWNGAARAERVAELVEGLGALLPGARPQLLVALREAEANLEVKLEVTGYPRQAVERFARGVAESGGTFVELWRLPKHERDAFRAASLSGETRAPEDFAAAARALREHLGGLAARVPPPPPAPASEPGQRRGRRFAVRLELEFRTELEFVREHALNISNGGLFVRTSHRPPPDSVVTVDVKLPNGEHLQGDAVVVHVIDDTYTGGVGLTFLTEDPTFVDTLDRYLASLAGDAVAAPPLPSPPPAPAPPSPPDSPSASDAWGPFHLESLLGRGGMAEVYRARYVTGPRAGQYVALKRVRAERSRDPEARELLLNEADIARSLKHPHIVGFVEYGMLEEGPYLALELLEGTDLGKLLAQCRRRRVELPMDVSLYVVRHVLEALEHAHRATGSTGRPLGLVHCDVSPHNVLVSHSGEVKLSDFGVARARGGSTPDARRLGKQFYRSPELLAGEVSVAADLWAAAVMLYELLSLEYPFPEGPSDAVDAAIRAGRVTPVRLVAPEVSDALALVLDRALAPSPAQRFASAAQFARALAPLYDERVATPLAVAAVVRGLMGSAAPSETPPRPEGGPE